MSARTTSATIVVIAVGLAGGCRQLADIGDPQPPDVMDGGPNVDVVAQACGAIAFAPSSCAACMAASCCNEAERCGSDAECAPFARCVAACAPSDLTCTSGCRTRFSKGYGALAAALASCEATSCGTACAVTCGGYVYPDSRCGACGGAQCCELAERCTSDVACGALGACERSCDGKTSCLAACEQAHPSGVASERAFGSCLQKACAATCIAPNWSCLEHPTSPATQVGGVSVTYSFVDYETNEPAPGLTLRGCGATDPACAPITTAVTTNGAGQAILSFGLTFDGYAEVSGPGYTTTLVYLPPLSADLATPNLVLLSPTALAKYSRDIATPKPGTAGLGITPQDCLRAPAPGVRFAIMPAAGSTPFYLAQGIPSKDATMTEVFGGGYAGGGFVNVEATVITVSATVVANGLALPPRTVFTRADGFTEVILYANGL